MAKAAPLQADFSGGEISPDLHARVDTDLYRKSLETCKNFIPLQKGAVTKRPGTKHLYALAASSEQHKLFPVYDFGGDKWVFAWPSASSVAVYKNDVANTTRANPLASCSPAATFSSLQHARYGCLSAFCVERPILPGSSNDEGVMVISWRGSSFSTPGTVWYSFWDGPYFRGREPESAATLTPNNVNATQFTLSTASAVNGSSYVLPGVSGGFQTTDVNRCFRFRDRSYRIGVRNSTTSVTVTQIVGTALPDTTASTDWEMGAFGASTGWPTCATFHEGRLWLSGHPLFPNRLFGSILLPDGVEVYRPFQTGAVGDSSDRAFSPSAINTGTVADNYAITFDLDTDAAVKWLASDERGLLVGLDGEEWLVTGGDSGLSPTNVDARRISSYGSSAVVPARRGKSFYFAQSSKDRVFDLGYYFDVDGVEALEVSEQAQHLLVGKVSELEAMRAPHPILWSTLEDGSLVGLTHVKERGNWRAGWHQHVLGGQSDAAGTAPVIESLMFQETSSGATIYAVVKRLINGSTVRYVERLNYFPTAATLQEDHIFVDSSVTYDDPKTISAITNANPGVVTCNSHGFANGDLVILRSIKGAIGTSLNGNTYTVAGATANAFQLSGTNTTSMGAYVSGGAARKKVTTVSGLSHLEGQTVAVFGDGAAQANRVVSGGAITLATAAATVQVGLPFTADLKLLPFEAGAADGTALGKTRRIHRAGFRFYRTLGVEVGTSFSRLDPVDFRLASNPNAYVPLFTGLKSMTLDADYDENNQICIRSEQPTPVTILAVAPQMVTQDR